MRRFLAGKVSVVEDGRMDGYYEEGEKYRNKRNYGPLVPYLIMAWQIEGIYERRLERKV
jgi:hypothetical protein